LTSQRSSRPQDIIYVHLPHDKQMANHLECECRPRTLKASYFRNVRRWGLDRARWRCMDQELFSLKAPNHCDVYDSKNEDEDATDLNGKYQGL